VFGLVIKEKGIPPYPLFLFVKNEVDKSSIVCCGERRHAGFIVSHKFDDSVSLGRYDEGVAFI
jgi:hypothetical protein